MSQSRQSSGDGSLFSSVLGSRSTGIENGMSAGQNVAASFSGMNSHPSMLSPQLPQNNIDLSRRIGENEPLATAAATVLQLQGSVGQFPAILPFGVANTNPNIPPLAATMIEPSQHMTISWLQLQQYQVMMAQLLSQEQQQRQQHQQSSIAVGFIHRSANQQYPSLFVVPSSTSIAPNQVIQNTFLPPTVLGGNPLSGIGFTHPQATNVNMIQSNNVVNNINYNSSNRTSIISNRSSGTTNIDNNGFNLDRNQGDQIRFPNQNPSLPPSSGTVDPQVRGIMVLGNLTVPRGVQAPTSPPSTEATQQQDQQHWTNYSEERNLRDKKWEVIRRWIRFPSSVGLMV